MKKLLVAFLLLFGILSISKVDAQTYYYKTYQFAIRYKASNGVWGDWSSWQPSNMTLTINLDDDLITVYSEKRQMYKVIEYLGSYNDDGGGRQVKYYVIDQDGDYGYVRLRIESSGSSQIYVDFNDVMFCWNLKKI